ncbi:YidC/Oxa1 family membrane protein insertase [Candidatus Mycoplasma haematobovis]|nr:YidC/Oxa1 family membrane protein insertase [Candidatus Mycoplasma haematobovis]
MILWSFIQSFAAPYTNYDPSPGVGLEFGFLPGEQGVDDIKFVLGSWSIAGPKYHAFFKPTFIYGPFLSWFVYPVARVFMLLMWTFHKNFPSLQENGLYVIFSMLIIMFFMRFITFWTTLRSSIYQEKQALHQPFLDAIQSKYDKYDFADKQAKLRKHQELSNYYKKHDLRPLIVLENFFINTPIFLIVFRLITICRPIKFTTLFSIWDLSKKPSDMVFFHFLENKGWAYLLLCLVIIPVNFSSQKITSWLAKLRNDSTKKEVIDKNSQTYRMQRIQKIMSIMFLLFTFFWSTSLAIYYFFNSIFTIFQSLIIHEILKSRKKKRNLFEIKLKKLGV